MEDDGERGRLLLQDLAQRVKEKVAIGGEPVLQLPDLQPEAVRTHVHGRQRAGQQGRGAAHAAHCAHALWQARVSRRRRVRQAFLQCRALTHAGRLR